jgi:hypothetical protein
MTQREFESGIQHIMQQLDAPSWTISSSWLYQMAAFAYRRRLPIANPTLRARVRTFLNGIRTGAVAL